MPTYDYRCTACDREVEVMHGISESGPQTCEDCGGAMRKALSSPAIHFKGSGWAKKDAAAATAKKAPPKASSASSAEDAGSGAEAKVADTGPSEKAATTTKTSDSKSATATTSD